MKNMPGRNQAELDQLRGNAALSSISQSPFAKRILSGTARSSQANEIGKASLGRSAAAITAKPALSTSAANPFKSSAATTAVNAATKTTPRVVQTSVPANPFKSSGSLSAARSAVSSAIKPTQPPKTTNPPKRETQLFHVDLFDLVKGHLLDEGYADTNEAALAIMANMSEEWRESIVEAEVLAQKGGVPGTMKVSPTKQGGFLGIGAKL
jgi:hypothetical protein